MKEEIQLPTVGRIVWVKRFDGDIEVPAIVQCVNYGTNIDACVFGAKGPEMLQSLMHRSDMGTHGAAWEWMPYQKGQAAKAEKLEDEIAKMAKGIGKAADRGAGSEHYRTPSLKDLPQNDDRTKNESSVPSPEDGKR